MPGTSMMDRLRNLIYNNVKPTLERIPETVLFNNLMYCDESDASL